MPPKSNKKNGTPAGGPGSDVYQRIKWNGWGAREMVMKVDENDPKVIIHPTGKPMRNLLPFINAEIHGNADSGRTLEKTPSVPIEEALQKLPQPVVNEKFMAELNKSYESHQIKLDGESRITHVFGKNYRDLWRARKAWLDRVPDCVVLPQSHDDCVNLMKFAQQNDVVIIPYGGGTNVTGCVEPSLFETRRMVVSIDMRRMNRLLSMDKESRIAVFEAGILGPDMDEILARDGFMFGHDPDSYIHSTLGGWIASRSSGAMSNRYGDIEDMTLSLKIVTPTRVIETPLSSRACGIDMKQLFIGSEGVFGIITECTVKIEPIPEQKHYEGWLFPTFEDGFRAFYECTRKGINPCALRLYDEDDTKMSFALKTDQPPIQNLISKGVKQYLQHIKGYDLEKLSLCIVGFEGLRVQVGLERSLIKKIFHKHGAFAVGAGAGNNWQEKKYDLPYVRDFALAHTLWADVFETTATYSNALALWRDVKQAVRDVWKSEGKKGWIGCHTAHQYKHGCCLYFTYAGQQFDNNDFLTFLKIKRAATEAMLKHKGNLSHHHGIGYEHVPWMERYMGKASLDILLKLKADIDPKGICNPSKLLPVAPLKGETEEQTAERRKKLQMFDKMAIPKSKL